MEAELRRQRYIATKDLIIEIEVLEKKIALLETKKITLEKELGEPQVFSNPVLAKEKNIEYSSTKQDLEELIIRWTNLTEELEKTEKSFQ